MVEAKEKTKENTIVNFSEYKENYYTGNTLKESKYLQRDYNGVRVVQPVKFQDVQQIADELKKNTTVVVNLKQLDYETRQQVTDFVCGACYALGGNICTVTNEIIVVGIADIYLTI